LKQKKKNNDENTFKKFGLVCILSEKSIDLLHNMIVIWFATKVCALCFISSLNKMKILTVSVLKDNYCYLVYSEKNRYQTLLIDCGHADTVKDFASKEGLTIVSVLTTHHHWDHAGGNEDLQKLIPNLKVYGETNVKALTHHLQGGEQFNVGSLKITAHVTPYHTKGHICYEIIDEEKSNEPSSLFTGDTLFLAGCGKFFEGTAEGFHFHFISLLFFFIILCLFLFLLF
jgi:hydroxyacylglutathione hydrolase